MTHPIQAHLEKIFTPSPIETPMGSEPIEQGTPGESLTRAPTTPAPEVPAAPAPTTASGTPPLPAAATDPISPSLRSWLVQQVSGHNVMTPEMYQYMGGDEILKQLQQFDPSAHWTTMDISGGEGGGTGQGLRLDFDPAKLPAVGGPGGGRSIYEAGLVPVYDDSKLHNAGMVYEDPYYGKLTIPRNIVEEKQDWWVTAAPLVIAGLATAGAAIPAMAAGGVAGGTAAVTGSAAGLAAGNIAGGVAAGATTPWWAEALKQAPSLAKGVTPPTATPFVPPAAPAPVAPVATNGLGIPAQYDATAFNGGGSAKKAGSNDSALVATQFADDPYRFSS